MNKQNVPQLAIQIWFLIQYSSDINTVVYASILFSSLSLFITVLTVTSQRNILKSRDRVTLEFDVTGKIIMENIDNCRNKIKSIKKGIASSLGINNTLLEITKPMPIKNGLKLNIKIYINYTKAIDMNIENDFNEATKQGQIAEIIASSWTLTSKPNISNIKYAQHESKERKKNTVSLKMVTSQSDHQIGTEMAMSNMNKNDTLPATETARAEDSSDSDSVSVQNNRQTPLI